MHTERPLSGTARNVMAGERMDLEPRQTEDRKPYEPPRLVSISLRPEEAVLGHCKTSHSGNHSISTCHPFGLCKTNGS